MRHDRMKNYGYLAFLQRIEIGWSASRYFYLRHLAYGTTKRAKESKITLPMKSNKYLI